MLLANAVRAHLAVPVALPSQLSKHRSASINITLQLRLSHFLDSIKGTGLKIVDHLVNV